MDIGGYTVAGNELWRIGAVFVILLGSFIAGRFCRFLIERYVKKAALKEGETAFGLVVASATGPLAILIFAAGFQLSMLFLDISPEVRRYAGTIAEWMFTLALAYFIYCMADVVEHYLKKITARTESKLDDMMVPMVRKALRVVIVMVVGLYVADSVSDKPITTLLAGLGVGGLAIALAGQDVIKNFFGSIAIFADRPFQVGERVIVDGFDGPIEEVGFRSTRLRTLAGHLVTIPNDKMANTSIENIGRRPHIRRLSNITITYDTPPEKVEKAVGIIREVLDGHEGMKPEFPPRVYFNEFNDWSLNIIMIYWYHPPDYWDFLAFNEKVNLEIMRRFEAEGIEFAFPTSTVYLARDEKRQLALRMLRSDEPAPPAS